MQVSAKIEKDKARLELTAENAEDRQVLNLIAQKHNRYFYCLYGTPDEKITSLELDFKK